MTEALAPHHGVDHLCAHRVALAERRRRVRDEGGAEVVHAAGLDLQAGRGPVAPVAEQVLAARVQRGQQVEAWDAAPRPLAPAIPVDPDQDHGHPVALREPRGDDPHHPRVPALAGEHQPGCGGELGREVRARPLGRVTHEPLGVTALQVHSVELDRDLDRPAIVGGEHQLHAGVGAVKAARGVDPGAEAKGEVALVEALGPNPGPGAKRP